MKFKKLTAIALTAMALMSCDEDMNTIGASLTEQTDKLQFTTGIYKATSRSISADSVYSRNNACYFGSAKDTETDTYVKCEFMTQFNTLDNYSQFFSEIDEILSVDDDGKVVSDSCELWLYFDKSKCYGDSLSPVKMNILELEQPLSDTRTYYSNFDPKREGYIRKNGLKKSIAFTMANLTYSDSLRQTSNYADIARISLNAPYISKSGLQYNNYGTYIMQNFFEHPEYFSSSYRFIHNICPGFFFELSDGKNVMTNISRMELITYFSARRDTVIYDHLNMVFASTAEVLQTNKVTNDEEAIGRLLEDDGCTYLKTPAGIFTEVTLPADEISEQHANDSLLRVKIAFQRQNSGETASNTLLSVPSTVVMVPKDSLNHFFESKSLYDNKRTYMATLSKNSYEFSNIGNLITWMATIKAKGLASDPNWLNSHPDWNKVVLVPVSLVQSTTSDYYGNTSTTTTGLRNMMSLSSTKLMGGADNPIDIEVIFAKFSQ